MKRSCLKMSGLAFASALLVMATAPIASALGESDSPPQVHLTGHLYPEGVVDEQGYELWMLQQTSSALERADHAEEPLERITLRLAAANAMLAVQCEPALSRWLQGFSDDADRERVLTLTADAGDLLEMSRLQLDDYRKREDHDAASADHSATTIEVLGVFASALSAVMQPDDSPQAAESRKDAARELSEYLEHNVLAISAAAVLWQGVLYGLTDRIDRAMLVLPLPADSPRTEILHNDFFARLVRCRFLVRRRAYAAAWDLLLTMEERSRSWFVAAGSRLDAARSVARVRYEICAAWRSDDEAPANNATAAWCDEMLGKTRERHFSDPSQSTVMRLMTAAPLVIQIPPVPVPPVPAPETVPHGQTAPSPDSQRGDIAPDKPIQDDAPSSPESNPENEPDEP